MEKRPLGLSDIRVSKLCLGTFTFGEAADEAACRSIIDSFADGGGNFIDTADVYKNGAAEEILGRVLVGRRSQFVIGTKCGMLSEAAVRPRGGSRNAVIDALNQSLRRLRTDYIDLYQMHHPDPLTPIEETLETMDQLVRSGKVRAVGISNYAGWQATKAFAIAGMRGYTPVVSLQMQYSLASRDIETDIVPLCRDEQVSIIAWAPLAGGILTGKYGEGGPAAGTRLADAPHHAHRINRRTQPIIEVVWEIAKEVGRTPSQVALRWVLSNDTVASAIVGTRSAAQFGENLAAIGWNLESTQLLRLEAASKPRLSYPHDLQHMLNCQPQPVASTGIRLQ